jgi:hypothetical protein
MHCGSQDDAAFLRKIIDQVQPNRFDIIIDDGGHTMNQQKVSIDTLIAAVPPGGFYVIEDLETSYMPDFGGDPNDHANHTTIALLKYMMDDLQDGKVGRKWYPHLLHHVYSLEIGPGIVFLRIKTDIP